MRILMAFILSAILLGLPTSASAECSWGETGRRCSMDELDIKLRSSEGVYIVKGVPLGYGEYFEGCVTAPARDIYNCLVEKRDALRERLGWDRFGGISIDVQPVGKTEDLSDIKNEVLRLRDDQEK